MQPGISSLHHFTQICKNRGRSEAKLAAFLKDFSIKKDWRVLEDSSGNYAIHIPSTHPNKSKLPSVILQAHLDMVQTSTHRDKAGKDVYDYETGIIPEVSPDGKVVHSKGNITTLGADCGIGIAMALEAAELEDRPPLIILLTSDEEGEMTGAKGLDPEKLELLRAEYMLNLDNNISEQICIGSGGGLGMKMEGKYTLQEARYEQCEITFSGLKGGHSGEDIDKGRIQMIQEGFKLLRYLEDALGKDAEDQKGNKKPPYELAFFNSGTADNAIPGECIIRIGAENQALLRELVKKYTQNLKILYPTETELVCDISDKNGKIPVMIESQRSSIVDQFSSELIGQIARDTTYNLPKVSNNIGVCSIEGGKMNMEFYGRADEERILGKLWGYLWDDFASIGLELKRINQIPAWAPNFKSRFLDIVKQVHTKVLGRLPKIEKTHSSLECGIIKDAIDSISKGSIAVISIGPEILNEHSPQEELNIETLKTCSMFLSQLLGVLGDDGNEKKVIDAGEKLMYA